MADSHAPPTSLTFRLVTLGGLALVDASGAALGQQRRRLALLAFLAAARGQGVSRDKLMAVLSPESSADSARHSLQQLLYHLRQQCGVELFVGTDPLRLDDGVITSDVADFDLSLSQGDLAKAVAVYRGPFLDGFHLDSAAFEEWASGERSRLAAQHRDALFRLAADADARGDRGEAIEWWRQLAALDPLNGRAALGLMRSLASAGDTPGALRHARVYEALVQSELGARLDAEVAGFVGRLRSGTYGVPGGKPSSDAEAGQPAPRAPPTPMPNDSIAAPSVSGSIAETARRVPSSHPGWRRVAGAVGVAVIAIAMLAGWWAWRRARGNVERGMTGLTVRSTIELPDSAPLASVQEAPNGDQLAISPDGRRLAYVAKRGTTRQLYVRELDRLEATPLSGTEEAHEPFFSPDGEWIGFLAGRELRKVSAKGGQLVTLATLSQPWTAAWATDERILVTEMEFGGRLTWVPSAGGVPRPNARQLEIPVGDMELVPGDKWILHSSVGLSRVSEIMLSSLETGRSYAITLDGVVDRDSADGSRTVHGRSPRLLRSGDLVYVSADGVPMVLPFDVRRRRVLGPPVPIPEAIRTEATRTLFAISRDGTLVYLPGPNAIRSRLVWLDYASGRVDTLPFPPAVYEGVHLSPDGREITVGVVEQGIRETRLLDTEHWRWTRLPPDSTFAPVPAARARDRPDLARVPLPSPDGRHIAVLVIPRGAGPDSGRGLWLATANGSEPEVKVASGPIAFHRFSPDGAWISYTDRSSGESEVYVAPVSQPARRVKITSETGDQARWTADGKTIVYVDGKRWYAVDVSTANGFRVGQPRFLFTGPFRQPFNWYYDISPDGRRFLLMVGPPEGRMNRLVVVTNWFAELGRLAPKR